MSVNKKAVAQSFSRAAPSYDQVAHVQQQVGRGLLALLQKNEIFANNALDLGCGTGWLTAQLKPYAKRITALDIAPGMLAYAKSQDIHSVIDEYVCADVEQLPLTSNQYDLLFSSFALQWCDDLTQVFSEIYALLKPGGHFVFSLPVEKTLQELKCSWRVAESRHAHVNEFLSVQRVRQGLDGAGFNVLSFEECLETVHYQSVRELTAELKTLGAHHVAENGTRTLTGKKTIANMIAAYESYRTEDKLLPASWHYVLVCAQKVEPI